jgi:hypothetical protein
MCFIKLEAWTKVIDNCEKALLIDLSNAKALYRRASALYMKKEYKLALSDLRRTNQEDAAVPYYYSTPLALRRVSDALFCRFRSSLPSATPASRLKPTSTKRCSAAFFKRKRKKRRASRTVDLPHVEPNKYAALTIRCT